MGESLALAIHVMDFRSRQACGKRMLLFSVPMASQQNKITPAFIKAGVIVMHIGCGINYTKRSRMIILIRNRTPSTHMTLLTSLVLPEAIFTSR